MKIKWKAAAFAAAVLLLAALAVWMDMMTAKAADLPETAQIVGRLVIPGREIPAEEIPAEEIPEEEPRGAGREDALRVDNERKLAEKLARWEARKTAGQEENAEEPEREHLGRYWITGYDICPRCCGNSNGITASGTQATVGRTCAAGRDLPFGTILYIEGLGERVVEDRGGAVNSGHIDVLCEDHTACYSITGWREVYVVDKAN